MTREGEEDEEEARVILVSSAQLAIPEVTILHSRSDDTTFRK